MARRVAVAFNDDASRKAHLNPSELIGEREVVNAAHEIADLLHAELIPVTDDIVAAIDHCRRFDVIVDLCEGVLGNPRFEKNFALALEMFGVAHTSCDPIAVGICTDKRLVKRILFALGLPTPPVWQGQAGTFIVKPALEDAGIGIDAASVVTSADVPDRVRYVEQTYKQPALVEEFIEGRELNQAIYCGTALPTGEVVFADFLSERERVVGWKAKWESGSVEDRATSNRTPAKIPATLRREVIRLCSTAASALCLDMAVRFDLRQSTSGDLFIVDINPNPDLGAGAGFRRALEAAHLTFPDFLDTLIIAAYARRSR